LALTNTQSDKPQPASAFSIVQSFVPTSVCAGVERLFVVLVLLACFGCSREQPKSLVADAEGTTKVRLALNWFPEAEHGGFYAASVNGFYEDSGLDVEIIPGGPNAPVIQEVVTGRVEFGVTNADQIFLGQAQGATVTALMAPLQNGPRCIMIHEKSGIEKFEDLNNMTIALSEAKPFAMFLKKKLPFENVEFVPYPGSVAEFMLNENFAQQAYVFSEPYIAKQKGGDPKVLMLSDAGFNLYASVLFADARTIAASPDVVKAMVTASVRGWKAYLADPLATNKVIHEANPEMGLEILAFGAEAMRPLCEVEKKLPLGTMTRQRWQLLHDQMVDVGAIDSSDGSVKDAFTTKFLP
jgi:NitT/TauT family transport system substrate-binding protein